MSRNKSRKCCQPWTGDWRPGLKGASVGNLLAACPSMGCPHGRARRGVPARSSALPPPSGAESHIGRTWPTACKGFYRAGCTLLKPTASRRELLGILDRASSLKDRENTHLGSSPTDYEGGAPSTHAHRTSPQRPAPDDASAVPAPAGAGLSLTSTRDRPRACLKASRHTTIQDSRTIFEHAVDVRTIFDPGCFRCRYLATAEEQASRGNFFRLINRLARHFARTNFDPRSHDLRSPTRRMVPGPIRGTHRDRGLAVALQRCSVAQQPGLLDSGGVQPADSNPAPDSKPSHFPGIIRPELPGVVKSYCSKLVTPMPMRW
jgi:hypothetical protein